MRKIFGTQGNWRSVGLLVLALMLVTSAVAFSQTSSDSSRQSRNEDRDTNRDRDRDKPTKPPAKVTSDTPFNPWNDGRFDKGKPVPGRENQPFNPWGDDRYDPKPKKEEPKAKPGYVVPYYRYDYPAYYWGADGRLQRYPYPPPPSSNWNNGRDDRPTHRHDRSRLDRRGGKPKMLASFRYGHWGFDAGESYQRSLYYYYGTFPYIERSRIQVLPYPSVTYNNNNVNITNNYYLQSESRAQDSALTKLDATLDDIRFAWLDRNAEFIDRHLINGQMIAVLMDGKYDYSIEAVDYIQMTADAIDSMETLSFIWKNVRQRSDGDYTAFAEHTYRNSSGNPQTFYVSYTLRALANTYVITEAGSSKLPLS